MSGQRGDLRGKPVVSWKPSKNEVLRRRMGSTVCSAAERSRKTYWEGARVQGIDDLRAVWGTLSSPWVVTALDQWLQIIKLSIYSLGICDLYSSLPFVFEPLNIVIIITLVLLKKKWLSVVKFRAYPVKKLTQEDTKLLLIRLCLSQFSHVTLESCLSLQFQWVHIMLFQICWKSVQLY